MQPGIFEETARCLALQQPAEKCAAVAELFAVVSRGQFQWDYDTAIPSVHTVGRPDRPALIDPAKVPRRRLGSAAGRVALIHAIAHIEFNAINLALDAVGRFRTMPQQFYFDWLSVAADEARHFQLLQQRLQQLGAEYGDHPAHDGLWEMAEKTTDSCLVRMALVPRVLEARGLDVTPGMMQRLLSAGDQETAGILRVILDEEVGHVAIGSRWFAWCCEQAGKDPGPTFLELLQSRYSGTVRGPFNTDARLLAGFSAEEMAALESAHEII
ncbi:MAG: ferritin-like domain-containing protein [Xanthomonadales bacterium]|nr:ferritin-like domain-containing protein [Xanthomonadales bacterium]